MLSVGIAYFSEMIKKQSLVREQKREGTYVDPKKIKWCKTCKHFKKIKEYADIIDGTWREKTMPEGSQIPCQIFSKTVNVWKDYFNLESNKRAIYPKDCSFWEKG